MRTKSGSIPPALAVIPQLWAPRYSLLLQDFRRDLMLISKKPESCWLAISAGGWVGEVSQRMLQSCTFPEQAGGIHCYGRVMLPPETEPEQSATDPLSSPPLLVLLFNPPSLSLSLSLGRFTLNNPTSEAVSSAGRAGRNPLSPVWLIITSVCLHQVRETLLTVIFSLSVWG